MKEKFCGIFPALLTPYNADGTVNEASIKKIIELNLSKRVNGFYVGGSTGEGIMLETEARKNLLKYAAEANGGRSTLIAHVGSISTDVSVELAQYARQLGYDAVSAVAPYYFNFGYAAIKQYYFDIAAATDLPMIIYNFPGANGFNLTKDMVEEFTANPQFIGIKHTTADLFALQQFKTSKYTPIVYNGYDEMLLAGLVMGADGGIGSTYNFMAEKYVALYEAFKQGDMQAAQKLQFEANAIIAQLIKYGVFACEKAILEEFGIEMGGCKRPFLPLSDEGKQAMKALVRTL